MHKTAVCTHITGDMQKNAHQKQEKYYGTAIRRQHLTHVIMLLTWCHGSWIFVFDLPLQNATAYRRVIIRPVLECEKMALWKNRISSTTMKLRKSLVKPVTRQNISSCSVLSPEIVMHDTFNVILWTSGDICVVVHDDLWWKNWTTRCNRFWRASCSRLEYVDVVKYI